MADEARLPGNVPGPFHVTDQCICCDACAATAPLHFERDSSGYSIVSRQPVTPDEVQLCGEAMEGCPVEAIHYTG